ncbi:hypothetical protein OY671_006856, partial [Metschnikowia pulcherrima]
TLRYDWIFKDTGAIYYIMATTGTPGTDAMLAQIMFPLSHLGMITSTDRKRIDDYFKKKAQEFSWKCKRHGELTIRLQKYKMYMDANMCPKEIQGLVRKEIPPEHYNTGHEIHAQTAMIHLRLGELAQQVLASQRLNIEPIETPQNECLFMFNSFLDQTGISTWSNFEEAKEAFMNTNRGFIVDYALEQAELYNAETFTDIIGKMMKRLTAEAEKLKKFLDKRNVDIQIDDDQENNIEYVKEACRREIEKVKKRQDKTDALVAKLLPGGQKNKSANAGTKKNQKANGKQGKKQKPGNGQAKGKNAKKDKPNQGKSKGKAAPRKRSQGRVINK